ncbi:MAG: GNAT family N-acetyltransferase [Pseudomonadota bacterium]
MVSVWSATFRTFPEARIETDRYRIYRNPGGVRSGSDYQMEFCKTDIAHVPWDQLDNFSDRLFSQRYEWLDFVSKVSGGEIVIATLKDGHKVIGYFSGILFHRFGVPILGSPFPGWTTTYMGFNLEPHVSRVEALEALKRFAFNQLGCLHLEILDRHLTMDQLAGLDVDTVVEPTYISPLDLDEEQILAGMSSACRRCIRKAEKNGLIIEEATPGGFADEYYEQLIDVFAKQDLRPPYTKQYVQTLIDKIHPSGDALLLRAKTRDGEKIASAIYFGHKDHSLFWGNGSLRSHQNLRPNEALHWYALRYWKKRGVKYHDWCGPNDYKKKYGPQLCQVPRIRISRYRALGWARDAAFRLYTLPRVIKRRRFQKQIKQTGENRSANSSGNTHASSP